MKINDGMCLSVLGQAVYDEVRGVTRIDKLKAVIAGGLYEGQKYLREKIRSLRYARLIFGSVGMVMLMTAAIRLYFNICRRNLERRIHEATR